MIRYTYPIQLLIFIIHMYLRSVWLYVGSKNGNQKDTCLKEIGLCDRYMITILGSIRNTIGGTHVMGMEIFTLIVNKIFV